MKSRSNEKVEGQELLEILSKVVEQSPNSVLVSDTNGIIEYINPRFTELTGYTKEEAIGKKTNLLKSGKNSDETYREMWSTILKGEKWYGELCNKKKNGDLFWEWVCISPLFNERNKITHFTVIKDDVTERKQIEKALRESKEEFRVLSITDDLTRLYNTRHFYEQLDLEMSRVNRYGQSLSIILIDIDNFKHFNDTYGHIDGDMVLARFGKVVKGCLRTTDSSYRYGGEEFVVILPITSLNEGKIVAEKIRAAFNKTPFKTNLGNSEHLSISLGVAEYKKNEKPADFVKRADVLMYKAKNTGKNRVCF